MSHMANSHPAHILDVEVTSGPHFWVLKSHPVHIFEGPTRIRPTFLALGLTSGPHFPSQHVDNKCVLERLKYKDDVLKEHHKGGGDAF